MKFNGVAALATATALALIPGGAHAGWFGDPLTELFIAPRTVFSAKLSPDGKHVAAIVMNEDQLTGVALVDTRTGSSEIMVGSYTFSAVPTGPLSVDWLDDEQMAVNFSDGEAGRVNLDGQTVGSLGRAFLGTFRPDGASARWALVDSLKKKSQVDAVALHGKETMPLVLSGVDGDILDWLTDGDGTLRVVRTLREEEKRRAQHVATWYRRDARAAWAIVDERSVVDADFVPVLVGPAGTPMIVQAYNGGDRLAMWSFDCERKAFLDVAARHPTEDIVRVEAGAGVGIFQRVVTDGLKPQTVWFDAQMAALQQAIDVALPDHVNVLDSRGGGVVLVRSYSDVDPGRFFALDEKTMQLRGVATVRPGVDPHRMQPMRTLTYPSFDGLRVPAYLTLPGQPNKPAPLVVLIHGGPQARDRWEWQWDVQELAAHGYAVFQPQFRGSTGFGRTFEEAGYGQWGLAMQDDITAGVRWLIDQKIADPDRICIAGASYGGYAALWGLEKTPELYRCGISTSGVSDLEAEMLEESDISSSAAALEVWRRRVGDPERMKAAFDAVSPLKHADRVKAPVLIVHGARDQRVPVSQGRRMVDALRQQHKDVEWVEFDDEGHSLGFTENRRIWSNKVFALLKRTIGPGIPPSKTP